MAITASEQQLADLNLTNLHRSATTSEAHWAHNPSPPLTRATAANLLSAHGHPFTVMPVVKSPCSSVASREHVQASRRQRVEDALPKTSAIADERAIGWLGGRVLAILRIGSGLTKVQGLRSVGSRAARKYGVHRRTVREALPSAWPRPR